MLWKKDKLFCEINPVCYAISEQKEICKRHLKNKFGKIQFAKTKQAEKLPNVVSAYHSGLIKRGKGIDPILQQNKAINIALACNQINGILIRPGEVFSFWKTVGKVTKRRGLSLFLTQKGIFCNRYSAAKANFQARCTVVHTQSGTGLVCGFRQQSYGTG